MRVALVAATVAATVAIEPVQVHIDDLQKVHGIGQSREQRIYEMGIRTYQQLGDVDARWLADGLGRMVSLKKARAWKMQAKAFVAAEQAKG